MSAPRPPHRHRPQGEAARTAPGSNAACAPWVRLLSADLDGELSSDESARLATHLAGCERCRERKALLVAQGAALRHEAEVLVSDVAMAGFSARVLRAIEAEASRPRGLALVAARITELWSVRRLPVLAGT